MTQYTLRLFLALLTIWLLQAVMIAQAQEPTLDQINEIASQINCPTCRGISLSNCETVTCLQWRDEIAVLLKKGYTPQQVLDTFVERHGQQILQEPPREGITLWLWVLPFVVLAIAALGLVYIMRQWQTVPTTTIAPAPKLDADYLNQVEQDLQRGA